MSAVTNKLKIGFLIDSDTISHSSYEIINFVAKNEIFHEPVIITGYCDNLKKVPRIKLYTKYPMYYLLVNTIQHFEKKSVLKNRPEQLKIFKVNEIGIFERLKVTGIWSKSKLFLSFTNEDLKKIEGQDFDVILRLGSGIMTGEILNTPRFGVISMHHGDNRVNRGGPPGFWEVINREPSTGFIIQKLTEELDGGHVFLRGNIPTANNWSLNRARIRAKSTIFMQNLLLDLAKKKTLPKIQQSFLHDRSLLKLDHNSMVLIKYLLKISIPTMLKKYMHLFIKKRIPNWDVSVSRSEIFRTSLWRFKIIKKPKHVFFADPFIMNYKGKKAIFVEEYGTEKKKGVISALSVTEESVEYLGNVIEEDFHLSFPFVFSHNQKIYMIPDSSKKMEIRLYECLEYPKKWKFIKTLMHNVDASDTMVFKKSDVWYMLTNIDSSRIGDHNSELHVFYSNNILSSKWIPIKSGNPVIFDSRHARNGGYFYYKSNLYRVSQIHSGNRYGSGIRINKIGKLNKNTYKEETIQELFPKFVHRGLALHHLHSRDGLTVYDFAKDYLK